MADREQKAAAKAFVKRWMGKGDEKQHTQLFWKELLQDVYGMSVNSDTVEFEKPVVYDGTTYIDVYIRSTRVMVEQKSLGISLDKQGMRHGEMLTPFEQAREYNLKLLADDKVKYIIVSNFETFRIHDLNKVNPHRNYTEISLSELPDKLHALDFMISEDKTPDGGGEDPISKQAGELVGALKEALKKQYKDSESENAKRSLTILCVRLVFCLYAEDSDIFPKHLQFHDYLSKFAKLSANEVRKNLIELFKILDTPEDERDPYLDDDLNAFPYVNGGLFSDENIEIPRFTDEIIDILLRRASAGFDWSQINPTIFGAMFESVMNDDERSSNGAHYTAPVNIHKVIDPLFLDGLKAELDKAMSYQRWADKKTKLEGFQDKLASLTFLDPACGSGNFLTLAFCELRRLENQVIAALYGEGQIYMEGLSPVKVSISQFYGIEINDFAVSVAKTALWIAEHQMLRETEDILDKSLSFLPLKSYPNIVHENALRTNWEDVVPKDSLFYIMGNPPFLYGDLTAQQKEERNIIFDGKGGELDYVACWYKIAANYMKGTNIECALVSTNSITQGQQVYPLWHDLFEDGITINFAHRTFRWDSEASNMAHVHCVIIGFSYISRNEKLLFDGDTVQKVGNINAYLLNAPNIIIEKRKKPISDVPEMLKGSSPVDGGNLLLSDKEYQDIISKEPLSQKYIRPFLGAKEYLHNIKRWCIWLENFDPSEVAKLNEINRRINAVKEFRLSSTKEATKRYAEYPTRFMEMRQPDTSYILIPRHSSENRKYIPFGFMGSEVICGDANAMLPNATLFNFGILISSIHMFWIKTVCGRLESRFRYSNDVVYNNFPWCEPKPEQKAKIEQTAQAILDARAKYPNSSLADMYGDKSHLFSDLQKAHKANDKAVMQAYGFKSDMSESEIVAELMKMYQKLTGGAAK